MCDAFDFTTHYSSIVFTEEGGTKSLLESDTNSEREREREREKNHIV